MGPAAGGSTSVASTPSSTGVSSRPSGSGTTQARSEYLPREGRLAQLEAWAGATDLALTAGERAFLAERTARAPHGGGHGGDERRWPGSRCLPPRRRRSPRSRSSSERGAGRRTPRDGPPAGCLRPGEPRRRPERSILLAIEAAETTRRHDGSVLIEAQQALHDALEPRVCCGSRASGEDKQRGSSIASPSRPTAPVWSRGRPEDGEHP